MFINYGRKKFYNIDRLRSKMFSNGLVECPKPAFEVFDLIECDEKCRTFLSDKFFDLDEEKVRLSQNGLALLDYVLPYLVNSLESNLVRLKSGK